MHFRTRETLTAIEPKQDYLEVSGDPSLLYGDCVEIAEEISRKKSLRSVIVSNCGLTSKAAEPIVNAISRHPKISKVDLSANKFDNSSFLVWLFNKTRRIHTLDLSDNVFQFEGDDYVQFLSAVVKADTLAVLKLPSDPYKSKSLDHKQTRDLFSDCKNLLKISFDDSSWETQYDIGRVCKKNKKEAQALIKRIRKRDVMPCRADAAAINERLPAIIYLAEEGNIREEIFSALQELKQYYGMPIDIEAFAIKSYGSNNGNPIAPVAKAPVSQPQAIQSVPKDIPVLSEEDILKLIEAGRDKPHLLMTLGKEVIEAFRQIPLASLHSVVVPSSQGSVPVRPMAAFLEKFMRAKEIIDRRLEDSNENEPEFIQESSKKGRPPAWFERTVGSSLGKILAKTQRDTSNINELNGLADAGDLAREAAFILAGIQSTIVGMEEGLTDRLATTGAIMEAYQKVGVQLTNIHKVGQQALESWRIEASDEESVVLPPIHIDDSIKEGPFEPLHVQYLDAQLTSIGQMSLLAEGHIANHMIHAQVEGKQKGALAQLSTQNIPMLMENVAFFVRQIEMMQRAEVMSGLADATRRASQSGREIASVAKETLASIEALASSMHEGLTTMGAVTARVGPFSGPKRRPNSLPYGDPGETIHQLSS